MDFLREAFKINYIFFCLSLPFCSISMVHIISVLNVVYMRVYWGACMCQSIEIAKVEYYIEQWKKSQKQSFSFLSS